MISRVKGIMLEPRATFKEIDTEFTKSGEVWGKYIIPLAAIGPIASMVGMFIFGKRVPFTSLTNPVPISTVISTGIATFVLALLSVFVLSRIVSLLAPGFGGQRNDVQGLKVAAYSSTSAWLGGIFQVLPALNLVSLIFALYSLVLLYVGLPIVMKVPKDRAMGYTAVVIIVWIVVYLIAGAVVAAF
ncbi:MAG TPA: Yip1 family protein [Gemmatimonadales bacterium]|nr:Yip1 family protein [Gemmatimonadales bacterium]